MHFYSFSLSLAVIISQGYFISGWRNTISYDIGVEKISKDSQNLMSYEIKQS